MDRLTERFSNGQAAVRGCGNNCKYDFKYCESHLENCPTISEIYEKLAEYEDLEEQGKLLKLPCAAGDTLYRFYTVDDRTEIYEHRIKTLTNLVHIMESGEIGKTVFFTKPEAEQALQRMNEMEG